MKLQVQGFRIPGFEGSEFNIYYHLVGAASSREIQLQLRQLRASRLEAAPTALA